MKFKVIADTFKIAETAYKNGDIITGQTQQNAYIKLGLRFKQLQAFNDDGSPYVAPKPSKNVCPTCGQTVSDALAKEKGIKVVTIGGTAKPAAPAPAGTDQNDSVKKEKTESEVDAAIAPATEKTTAADTQAALTKLLKLTRGELAGEIHHLLAGGATLKVGTDAPKEELAKAILETKGYKF